MCLNRRRLPVLKTLKEVILLKDFNLADSTKVSKDGARNVANSCPGLGAAPTQEHNITSLSFSASIN